MKLALSHPPTQLGQCPNFNWIWVLKASLSLPDQSEHVLKVSATGACALAEGHPPHIQSTASGGAVVWRVTLCDRKQQVPTLGHLYWYAHQLNKIVSKATFS